MPVRRGRQSRRSPNSNAPPNKHAHLPGDAPGPVERAAAGHDAEQVVDALVKYSRYAVPQPLLMDVIDTMGRFGGCNWSRIPRTG